MVILMYVKKCLLYLECTSFKAIYDFVEKYM